MSLLFLITINSLAMRLALTRLLLIVGHFPSLSDSFNHVPIIAEEEEMTFDCHSKLLSEQCHPKMQSITHKGADGANMIKSSGDRSSENEETVSSCSLYLAESTIPNSGYGLFSGVDSPHVIGQPDIAINVIDVVNANIFSGLEMALSQYSWESNLVGGQFEGKASVALLPGVGSLSNGNPNNYNAVLARGYSEIDEADLTRMFSPNAGAISHYHNISFVQNKNKSSINQGDEIFVNYGDKWFEERVKHAILDSDYTTDNPKRNRSIKWLEENGSCMDNLQVGMSHIENAGRGAFATRFLKKGSVISTSPLLQISHEVSLSTFRIKSNGNREDVIEGRQLLLNYCFGHPQSSILFFPLANVVNFINHASMQADDEYDYDGNLHQNTPRPNAEVRWSKIQHGNRGKDWIHESLESIRKKKHTGLTIDYVATRDIKEGEEILIDYGDDFEDEYFNHCEGWESYEDDSYFPSYIMNEGNEEELMTVEEQKMNPYPDNFFTSCYHFEQRHLKDNSDSKSVWSYQKGIFDPENAHPCHILKRERNKSTGKSCIIHFHFILLC